MNGKATDEGDQMNTSDHKDFQERLANMPPEFSDFSSMFEREIRPALQEKEVDRIAAWKKAKTFGAIGIVSAAIIAGLAIFVFKTPFAAIFGAFVGFGFGAYGYSDVQKISAHAKELMVGPVAERFGLTFNSAVSEKAKTNLEMCRSLKVLPGSDRESLQDELIGERNGVPLEFFEAHLEERRTTTDSKGNSRTTWVTVFRGQIWVFGAPKTFHGTTRIARDSGVFNALGSMGANVHRARLEDPEFEKKFEVYTTDQVEARYLLTPNVMQALLDLEAAFKGAKVRCTFHDNKIYAAAEAGNLFEPGSMMKSLDDPSRVAKLLEDFAAVFRMVDSLSK